ncbi:cytochrome-c peroxidase [Marinobacter changyiensis]|uniref:cytochrome-c peroxidase n=1 Tax=Marinobacter changyiensis TaxID=2604091 RepID=UPI0015D3C1DE|nr:cytochrome c peroxidase [Marinobacter changyiensis]
MTAILPRTFSGIFLVFLSIAASGDDFFSEREVRILESLSLSALGPVPESPSNRIADHPVAAILGKSIFFDSRFSLDGTLSCASCHQPDKAFSDGLALAQGMERTGRNTPTLLGVAYQQWFYWDGRRDSLWSQALIPFEAPSEMATSRVGVIKTFFEDENYRKLYKEIFGILSNIVLADLPDQASPLGPLAYQNEWYRLPRHVHDDINRIFSNIGKAIAAFERTLAPPSTKFDEFVKVLRHEGESRALEQVTQKAADGMKLFMNIDKTQCLRCHNGPMLTNGGFHNIGTGIFRGSNMDFGRLFGLQAVLLDEFNCLGKYSDAVEQDCDAINYINKDSHQPLRGAFKTPTLRYLEKTKPYFHDGRFNSLIEVIGHYSSKKDVNTVNQNTEIEGIELNQLEIEQLVEFVELLN